MASKDDKSAYSEPVYAMADKKEFPWYIPNIDKYLQAPETRQLLETYSNLAPEEQSQHVHAIRDQAWAIRSYPCTGLGVWLVPFISRSQVYSTILQRLKAGEVFMDIGCFLGTDMRQLAFDGAPTHNMYGVDIVSHWEVGYAMYRDKESFKAKFIEADVLSTDNPSLQTLEGRADIISISAVLHQWPWDRQVEAAKRIVAYSKLGSLVMGYQVGHVEGKVVVRSSLNVGQFGHNPATFEKMWDQVGAETGTKWQTKAVFRSWDELGWDSNDMTWMQAENIPLDFAVSRIE